MLETELNPKNEKWFSDIEAPQIVNDPNLISWNDESDLVIVGLGGAGIAAANEALDQDHSVIAIVKTSGGSNYRVGDVFYIKGGGSTSNATV